MNLPFFRKADRVKPSNPKSTTTAPAVKTESPATSTTHPSTNQNEPTTQTAPIETAYDQVSTVASTKAGEEGTQEINPITDQSLLWMTLCPKPQTPPTPSRPPSPKMLLKRGEAPTKPPNCYGFNSYG